MAKMSELKVGILVTATAVLGVLFAWFLGFKNPFHDRVHLYITYHFAGGIELGSPVRVSGIKVGKVEAVEFFVPSDEQVIATKNSSSTDETIMNSVIPVRLKISVTYDALKGIKKDSKFYINLAGIIGERYIEITPGSPKASPVEDGDVLAGVDPPRIDQLLSQSFDLAGEILELVNKNETDVVELLHNLVALSGDLKVLTAQVNSKEAKETIQVINKLIWRMKDVDADVLKKFLQKDGIRAHIF